MEDLSLHILDIAENSIAASAGTIEIRVDEDWAADLLTVEICDDGAGMNETTRGKAVDPFFTTRTTRKVGLGLSLLAQAAEQADGRMQLDSTPGKGTVVRATFRLSHPDCKPMGDIGATINTLVAGHPDINIVYEYKNDDSAYRFDTREAGKT
jgi:signal transduction histidine kinase